MTQEERLARLEQRLGVLEGLMRQLLADRVAPPAAPVPEGPPPIPSAPREPAITPDWLANPSHDPPTPPPLAAPAPAPRAAPGPPRLPVDVVPPARPGIISEEWLGQRGLLAVGVVFIVLAAGYLLKLSFDRGWISPLVRCVAGAAAGAAVALLGCRLHQRGTRTYGGALIGAGAAIVYLAVWAAGRLYQFLPPTPAVLALALVSLGLAGIAWAVNLEALGATAALGAFLAPMVIGQDAGSVDFLLLYLGGMGAALGTVAAQRHWRVAMVIVALAYFGIATSGTLREANATGLYLYALLGGAGGLYVGLRERWIETRLLAFGGGWGVLGVADNAGGTPWLTLAGGVGLTLPVAGRALRALTVWPDRPSPDGSPSLGDSFYFYLSPILLSFALAQVAPDAFAENPGLVGVLLAVPYLALGYQRERRPFAVVGVSALAIAALIQWPARIEATWALLALVHLWAFLDHPLKRRDGAGYALATYTVAVIRLLLVDAEHRPSGEAAFLGAGALTLWWAIETAVVLAAGLLREVEAGILAPLRPRQLLWATAGLLLLFGVTGELTRAFHLSPLDRDTAELAGGLAVSAWWISFAAGCFFFGFRRRLRPLRLAGFLVAGLALLKVLLVDLSQLDAFYRIGSALILGVVSLAVAYVYNRRAGA